MTNPIIFNVEEGATRTMTLQGTVGGVSLVSTFDLYVYRFNDAIQQYEQFRVQKGWINTLLLAGQSQPLTLTLPGGEYLFVLNTASGISVLTGYTLAISQDHTYAVDSITANTTGNVLSNDVAPTDALLTEVNGVAIAATGTTEVNGLYGSLIIDARGNYTYTLKNGVGATALKRRTALSIRSKRQTAIPIRPRSISRQPPGRWMRLMMSAIPLASPRFRIPLPGWTPASAAPVGGYSANRAAGAAPLTLQRAPYLKARHWSLMSPRSLRWAI